MTDPRPLGILMFARAHGPYGLGDIEMADVLGTFIGRVVKLAARRPPMSVRGSDAEPSTVVESDRALAESQHRNS